MKEGRGESMVVDYAAVLKLTTKGLWRGWRGRGGSVRVRWLCNLWKHQFKKELLW
jgi:hypothetical protein